MLIRLIHSMGIRSDCMCVFSAYAAEAKGLCSVGPEAAKANDLANRIEWKALESNIPFDPTV